MGKRFKYTGKQQNDAIEGLKSGMTDKEVAELVGVPPHMIYWWKRQAGLGKSPPLSRQPKTAELGKTFTCKVCGKPFPKVILLAQHMSVVHPKPRFAPDQVSALVQAEVRRVLPEIISATPLPAPKWTLEDFMNMLRELIADNTKLHETITRERKAKEEWQKTAGKLLEQTQQVIK